MSKISIRLQKLQDADRFFNILNNDRFLYFPTRPASAGAEKKWLRQSFIKRQKNIQWNYAVLYGSLVVGAVGITINTDRPHIGEIGYFVEEKYWGRGIATRAVKLVEREGFKKLKLTRLEILMEPANKASEKVAIKNNYQKEGKLKKIIKGRDGSMKDCWLYAKTL